MIPRVLAVVFLCLAAVAVGEFLGTKTRERTLEALHMGALPTGQTYIIDGPIGINMDSHQCIGLRGIPYGILICKDDDDELWAVHQKVIDEQVRSARR